MRLTQKQTNVLVNMLKSEHTPEMCLFFKYLVDETASLEERYSLLNSLEK